MKTMTRNLQRSLAGLVAVCGCLLVVAPADAAEIVLKAEVRCERPLVRLADVAEIYATDTAEIERLAAVELFPAPAPGCKRTVRAREVHDLLGLRGLHVGQCRMSGASQVELAGASVVIAPAVQANGGVPAPQERQVVEAVKAAILKHLQQHTASKDAFEIVLNLSDVQVRELGAMIGKLSVAGGQKPWTGTQVFTVGAGATGEAGNVVVETQITLPPGMVVARRSLPRGAVLQAADVALEHVRTNGKDVEAFSSLDEVVGHETTRAIPPGQPIDRSALRSPVLVRRGEIVSVVARSAGLKVRTTARAREDGSQGDLVAVESVLNRQAFFARVTGIQEVEILAHAAQAGGGAPRSVQTRSR